MTTQDYQTGDRIHYTGDQANSEKDGIIIARKAATNYTPFGYDIAMNDGHTMWCISPLEFEPGRGRRFWLLSEWQEDRKSKMALFIQWAALAKEREMKQYIEVLATGHYYIVQLVNGKKKITLRIYDEGMDARRFADELSGVTGWSWIDRK